MRIENINRRIRCEMPNCRNLASAKIKKDGFIKSIGLYICEDCMKELYGELAKRIVPKSPVNVFNKKSKSGVKKDG